MPTVMTSQTVVEERGAEIAGNRQSWYSQAVLNSGEIVALTC